MRLKIIAGNLIAVLLLGFASFFFLNGQLKAALGAAVDGSIDNKQTLFDRSWRLSSLELVRDVEERAQSREVIDVFAGLDESSRRQRAHQASNRTAEWFGDSARRGTQPDIVLVTDETGKVVARNADPNRMFGELLGQNLPALRAALAQGTASVTVWDKTDDAKILQTVVAPVRGDQSNIIGALVVAYDISDGFVQREHQALEADIAILVDGKVYSSSLAADRRGELKSFLFGESMSAATSQALASDNGGGRTWRATLGGDEYIGSLGHLDFAGSTHAAFAVLENRTAAIAPASQTTVILGLTVVLGLFVLGYGFVVGSSLLRPLEQIEETILAIMNGRPDLRIELEHPDFGGLAYRINQLLNVFTGVAEDTSDEEGRLSEGANRSAWKDQAFSEGGGAAQAEAIDDAAVAQKLEAEPEAEYFARIFREFVAAKQALGESAAAMTEEKFVARFRGMADAHAKKHGVRAVRYQIDTVDGQVQVRPVLIR